MASPRAFMSSSWGTGISSRLYYNLLLQCLKSQTPIDGISKRCLNTTAALYNQQDNVSWTFDPLSGASPVPHVQPETTSWTFDPISGVPPIPYLQQQPSISDVSGPTTTSATFQPPLSTSSTSNLFADAFTAVHNKEPKEPDYTLPIFDPSFFDSSKDPSAEEIDKRVQRQLKRKSGVWHLFRSTITKNLESEFIGNRNSTNSPRSLLNKGSTFLDTDLFQTKEFSCISLLVSAQFKRNMLIRKIKDLSLTKSFNPETGEKGEIRDFTFSRFNLNEFKFLSSRAKRESRIYGSVLLMKRELAYVSEMIRLYEITGNEELKKHVEWTTPMIRNFAVQFAAERRSDEKDDKSTGTEHVEMKMKTAKRVEENLQLLDVELEAVESAYAYLIQAAKKVEAPVSEELLSPLYSANLAFEFKKEAFGEEEEELEKKEFLSEENQI